MIGDAFLIYLALGAVFGVFWLYYALKHVAANANIQQNGLMQLGLGALGLSSVATLLFLVLGFVGY